MRIFLQSLSQRLVKVDAQVVGKQDDDEQDVTELISDRAAFIFDRTRLVAEPKVELAAKLADLFGQPREL